MFIRQVPDWAEKVGGMRIMAIDGDVRIGLREAEHFALNDHQEPSGDICDSAYIFLS